MTDINTLSTTEIFAVLKSHEADREEVVNLFRTMQSNLDASKCLYKNEFYPQSIFNLQQCVEIGWKAYAKHMMILKNISSINHYVLRNFNPKQSDFFETLSSSASLIPKIPELNNLFEEMGINPLKLPPAIKRHAEENKDIIDSLPKHIDWTDDELTDLLSYGTSIAEAAVVFLESIRKIPDIQESESVQNEINTQLAPLMNLLFCSGISALMIPDEMKKEIFQESSSEEGLETHWNISNIKIIIQNLGCFIPLIILNVILSSQFSGVRYPNGETSPLEKYTESNSIVRYMPQLFALTENVEKILSDYLEIHANNR